MLIERRLGWPLGQPTVLVPFVQPPPRPACCCCKDRRPWAATAPEVIANWDRKGPIVSRWPEELRGRLEELEAALLRPAAATAGDVGGLRQCWRAGAPGTAREAGSRRPPAPRPRDNAVIVGPESGCLGMNGTWAS